MVQQKKWIIKLHIFIIIRSLGTTHCWNYIFKNSLAKKLKATYKYFYEATEQNLNTEIC